MIHGNRSPSQRTAALHGFQRGNFQVLVATDVAARGIHVEDVAHVFNYDLPEVATLAEIAAWPELSEAERLRIIREELPRRRGGDNQEQATGWR